MAETTPKAVPKEVTPKQEKTEDKPIAKAQEKDEIAKEKDEGKEKGKEGDETPAEGAREEAVPVIDMDTFSQILEMDDDDTHEFSMSIVENYMEQAESTFTKMDTALEEKNLPELSRLGHFLKGSSAALGISQVQTGCEKMQHYGQLKRGANGPKLLPEEALSLIEPLLVKIKAGHQEAEKWLKDFYGMSKE